MKYLILGCGPAGIAAAKMVRGKDKKGEIVAATEEQGPPYLRPLLTNLIMGRFDVAWIEDPQAQDLADRGIEVRHGKRAVKVDSVGNRVIFADGAEEAYDVLLVATGGKPEIPLPLRKEHPAILPFDSLEDTLRIADRVPCSGTVAVYDRGSWRSSRAAHSGSGETMWSGSSPTYPDQAIRSRVNLRPTSSTRSETRECGSSAGRISPLYEKRVGDSRSNPPKKE